MDGYIANLKAICDLADKYDALVMVDDSHAVGFVGEKGKAHTNTVTSLVGSTLLRELLVRPLAVHRVDILREEKKSLSGYDKDQDLIFSRTHLLCHSLNFGTGS